MSNNHKEEQVKQEYVPVKPVDPNDYTVAQYLFDTNTLLTKIENELRILIQLMADKKETRKPREVKTIGITR